MLNLVIVCDSVVRNELVSNLKVSMVSFIGSVSLNWGGRRGLCGKNIIKVLVGD